MFSFNHVPGVPVTPWSPTLLEVRSKIANLTGIDFNSVLANLYEQPQEHSAWHSDDDPWLGYPEPSDIVSISLGHGSLGVMGGNFQKFYQHSVPGVNNQKQFRIN